VYYSGAGGRSLGQVTGIVDRFVNRIKADDAVLVPDSNLVYIGIVQHEYSFHADLLREDEGYPHWIKVRWLFDKKPVTRSQLPAVLHNALKGRQTVYGIPIDTVLSLVQDPDKYLSFDSSTDYEYKSNYVEQLSTGVAPGINSPAFEKAVLKVLQLYYPTLRLLATTNAPVGADTDLIAELPGAVVVRIQVKCFQDAGGLLPVWVVRQLRDSMEAGQSGIVVTTNRVGKDALGLADADSEKPIGFIDVSEFAQLVFDNQASFTDEDLWSLGLKRSISGR